MKEAFDMNLDLPFVFNNATRIFGSKGTGKTKHLINLVTKHLTEGKDPSQLVVVCATPTAAACFSEEVEHTLGISRTEMRVKVTTARQWALEILDCSEAYELTGRRARMVFPFEKTFIQEDIKTCGMRPKRLKEMLKFLERGWTEFADENPEWLIDNEERDLQALYRDYLALYEALLEPEICNMALKYLRCDSSALNTSRVDTVLVDDYQLMNRTSQLLTCLLTSKSLVVTADKLNTTPVFDSYPYANGVTELEQLQPVLTTTYLDGCKHGKAIARITNAVIENGNMNNREDEEKNSVYVEKNDFQLLMASSPKNEFQLVGKWVSDVVSQGIAPENIAVVHPDVPSWGNYAKEAILKAGFEVQYPTDSRVLRGDARNLTSCEAMQLVSLVLLAGKREDSMAWRCWCGYGDWLTSSAAFEKLNHYASYNNLNLYQTLVLLSNHQLNMDFFNDDEAAVESLKTALNRYESAEQILESVKDLKGFELIETLSKKCGFNEDAHCKVKQLCSNIDNSTFASVIRDVIINQLVAPTVSRHKNAICVGPFSILGGMNPKAVLVVGMVNGLFPVGDYFDQSITTIDKQKTMFSRDVARFYVMACSSEQIQAFSSFEQINVDLAYKMKLKIERIGLKSGQKIASLSKSKLLDLLTIK